MPSRDNAFIRPRIELYEHGGLIFGMPRRGDLLQIRPSRRPQGAQPSRSMWQRISCSRMKSHSAQDQGSAALDKIERAYSKEKILELYLNEIYLGFSAYGVAASSLLYFDKSVHELTIAEAAYLAALPKAPTYLHPFRQRERAIERRNYVIDRMVENGYVKTADGEKSKKEPLNVVQRPSGAHVFAAEYFAEEVRREIYEKYGEKKLYEGGIRCAPRSTEVQVIARKALADGLVNCRAQGYRGPVAQMRLPATGAQARRRQALNDIAPWRLAVVLETLINPRASDSAARERGARSERTPSGNRPLDGVKWAKPATGPNRFKPPTKSTRVPRRRDLCRAACGKDGKPARANIACGKIRKFPAAS